MTMAEKILARHRAGGEPPYVKPGDSIVCKVDGGYSHEFTTAQVHEFLRQEHGDGYRVKDPAKFAVFEDHVIYADGVPAMAPYGKEIQTLRDLQRAFQRHTGVRDYSAKDGVSPGICHQVAREQFIDPGDLIQATDSHTCMGGGNNALAYGVGATEYAALIHSGVTLVKVPESIRFELTGRLPSGVTAKDLMLYILLHYAKPQKTLDRVLEFGGPGLSTLSMDERATLANMATECTARSGLCEGDEQTVAWIQARRPGTSAQALRARLVRPDPGAVYDGGVHTIDLGALEPMVAHPGDPDRGVPSDPRTASWCGAWARSGSTSPTADRAPRASATTSTCTPRSCARRRPRAGAWPRACASTSSSAAWTSSVTPRSAATSSCSGPRASRSSGPGAAPASAAGPGSPSAPTRSPSRPSTATTRGAAGRGGSTWPPRSPSRPRP
jgi:homoaconitase/3-isopropylmalate dehydratase large subunit